MFRWSSRQASSFQISSLTVGRRSGRKMHRPEIEARVQSRPRSPVFIITSQMSRLLAPNSNASIVSLISPFTRKSLKPIKDALSAAYATKYPIKLTETHAAVLVPLCNLNGNPGLLLKVREKTRAHSEEVGWAPSRFALVGFHPCWSSSSGGKVDPTDESVLHAALREAKEEVGIDVEKIEILGRLGPPTRSLGSLRVWL